MFDQGPPLQTARERVTPHPARLSRWLSRAPMDNYEQKKRIGRGNYGTVYLARDKRNMRW